MMVLLPIFKINKSASLMSDIRSHVCVVQSFRPPCQRTVNLGLVALQRNRLMVPVIPSGALGWARCGGAWSLALPCPFTPDAGASGVAAGHGGGLSLSDVDSVGREGNCLGHRDSVRRQRLGNGAGRHGHVDGTGRLRVRAHDCDWRASAAGGSPVLPLAGGCRGSVRCSCG